MCTPMDENADALFKLLRSIIPIIDFIIWKMKHILLCEIFRWHAHCVCWGLSWDVTQSKALYELRREFPFTETFQFIKCVFTRLYICRRRVHGNESAVCALLRGEMMAPRFSLSNTNHSKWLFCPSAKKIGTTLVICESSSCVGEQIRTT